MSTASKMQAVELILVLAFHAHAVVSLTCFWCSGVDNDRMCETRPRQVSSYPAAINCTTKFCVSTKVMDAVTGTVGSFARSCDHIPRGNQCVKDFHFVTCYETCTFDLCNSGNPDPSYLPTRAYSGVLLQLSEVFEVQNKTPRLFNSRNFYKQLSERPEGWTYSSRVNRTLSSGKYPSKVGHEKGPSWKEHGVDANSSPPEDNIRGFNSFQNSKISNYPSKKLMVVTGKENNAINESTIRSYPLSSSADMGKSPTFADGKEKVHESINPMFRPQEIFWWEKLKVAQTDTNNAVDIIQTKNINTVYKNNEDEIQIKNNFKRENPPAFSLLDMGDKHDMSRFGNNVSDYFPLMRENVSSVMNPVSSGAAQHMKPLQRNEVYVNYASPVTNNKKSSLVRWWDKTEPSPANDPPAGLAAHHSWKLPQNGVQLVNTSLEPARRADSRLGGSASQHLGDSTNQNLGDSMSQHLGDSASQRLRDSTSQHVGDSASQRLRDSTSQHLGDSTSQHPGDSKSQLVTLLPDSQNNQLPRDSGQVFVLISENSKSAADKITNWRHTLTPNINVAHNHGEKSGVLGSGRNDSAFSKPEMDAGRGTAKIQPSEPFRASLGDVCRPATNGSLCTGTDNKAIFNFTANYGLSTGYTQLLNFQNMSTSSPGATPFTAESAGNMTNRLSHTSLESTANITNGPTHTSLKSAGNMTNRLTHTSPSYKENNTLLEGDTRGQDTSPTSHDSVVAAKTVQNKATGRPDPALGFRDSPAEGGRLQSKPIHPSTLPDLSPINSAASTQELLEVSATKDTSQKPPSRGRWQTPRNGSEPTHNPLRHTTASIHSAASVEITTLHEEHANMSNVSLTQPRSTEHDNMSNVSLTQPRSTEHANMSNVSLTQPRSTEHANMSNVSLTQPRSTEHANMSNVSLTQPRSTEHANMSNVSLTQPRSTEHANMSNVSLTQPRSTETTQTITPAGTTQNRHSIDNESTPHSNVSARRRKMHEQFTETSNLSSTQPRSTERTQNLAPFGKINGPNLVNEATLHSDVGAETRKQHKKQAKSVHFSVVQQQSIDRNQDVTALETIESSLHPGDPINLTILHEEQVNTRDFSIAQQTLPNRHKDKESTGKTEERNIVDSQSFPLADIRITPINVDKHQNRTKYLSISHKNQTERIQDVQLSRTTEGESILDIVGHTSSYDKLVVNQLNYDQQTSDESRLRKTRNDEYNNNKLSYDKSRNDKSSDVNVSYDKSGFIESSIDKSTGYKFEYNELVIDKPNYNTPIYDKSSDDKFHDYELTADKSSNNTPRYIDADIAITQTNRWLHQANRSSEALFLDVSDTSGVNLTANAAWIGQENIHQPLKNNLGRIRMEPKPRETETFANISKNTDVKVSQVTTSDFTTSKNKTQISANTGTIEIKTDPTSSKRINRIDELGADNEQIINQPSASERGTGRTKTNKQEADFGSLHSLTTRKDIKTRTQTITSTIEVESTVNTSILVTDHLSQNTSTENVRTNNDQREIKNNHNYHNALEKQRETNNLKSTTRNETAVRTSRKKVSNLTDVISEIFIDGQQDNEVEATSLAHNKVIGFMDKKHATNRHHLSKTKRPNDPHMQRPSRYHEDTENPYMRAGQKRSNPNYKKQNSNDKDLQDKKRAQIRREKLSPKVRGNNQLKSNNIHRNTSSTSTGNVDNTTNMAARNGGSRSQTRTPRQRIYLRRPVHTPARNEKLQSETKTIMFNRNNTSGRFEVPSALWFVFLLTLSVGSN